MEPPEIVEVDNVQVSCAGEEGGAGHPKVYLAIGDPGYVECPYCDRRFVLKAGAKPSAAH
jgi:uncharacterized Zn-finger protein